MTNINQDQANELIMKANNILIAPSSPDGDSIGSALAMLLALQRMGKNVTVVSSNEVPEYLQFLPFTDKIETGISSSKDFVITLSTENAEVDHLKYEVEPGKINIIVTPKNGEFSGHDISLKNPGANYDLIITVDTGDLVQIGTFYTDNKDLFDNTPLLNIDHHASNGHFGTHNWLDFNVAATTQLLTPLILKWDAESEEMIMDEDIATLLLVGIITDTGSFQHSNTSPEAFEVAATLLEHGARQQEMIKEIFKTKSLETLKLWGRVLSKISYLPESKLVFSTVTLEDIADTGATLDDTGGIIDELMSNAPDAEVVMLLKEKEPGFIGGSLRAPGKIADVSEIAGMIGGGGHKKAAGFRIRDKSFEEAKQIAIEAVRTYMNDKQGVTESPEGQLFPGLVVKPQNSIPVPSAGGEDMLLQDFRKRKTPEEEKMKDMTTKFFQEGGSQEKTVEEVLKDMNQASSDNTDSEMSASV
jgi:bifunctional oligoribonuclease and PAP phosphatase NrnA